MNWGDNWSGSHLIQEINLAAYTFQPTVSFKICDRLSIGAGLMISWGNFDLSRAMLPVGAGNQTLVAGFNTVNALLPALGPAAGLTAEQIAQYQATAQQGAAYFTQNLQDRSIVSARLSGSANVAIGVNAGIFWDVTDQWSVAMSYRSRMNMKVDKGTARLIYASQEARQLLSFLNTILQTAGQSPAIPALDQGTFHTQLALPTTVTWGVSYRPDDRWQMGVDLQWIGWSAYKDLNVSFNEKELGIKDIYSVKNYSNTLSARFGAEYRGVGLADGTCGYLLRREPGGQQLPEPRDAVDDEDRLLAGRLVPAGPLRGARYRLLLRLLGRPRTHGLLPRLRLRFGRTGLGLHAQLQTPCARSLVRHAFQFLIKEFFTIFAVRLFPKGAPPFLPAL